MYEIFQGDALKNQLSYLQEYYVHNKEIKINKNEKNNKNLNKYKKNI